MENIHFEIRVVLNEEKHTWNLPRVEKDIEFTIPYDLFTSEKLGVMVKEAVIKMKEEYPLAVERWQEEESLKEKIEEE